MQIYDDLILKPDGRCATVLFGTFFFLSSPTDLVCSHLRRDKKSVASLNSLEIVIANNLLSRTKSDRYDYYKLSYFCFARFNIYSEFDRFNEFRNDAIIRRWNENSRNYGEKKEDRGREWETFLRIFYVSRLPKTS